MLAAEHRLTSGEEFRRAVRRGRRAGSRLLVVHLDGAAADEHAVVPRVGFIVSRAVGGAVVRNRVKRRLRHLARERLRSLPGPVALVVRAQPAAADASYQELGQALDRCLQRLVGAVAEDGRSQQPEEVRT
jgi:ribonuclease P protein component